MHIIDKPTDSVNFQQEQIITERHDKEKEMIKSENSLGTCLYIRRGHVLEMGNLKIVNKKNK